jgi:hypothetical protein
MEMNGCAGAAGRRDVLRSSAEGEALFGGNDIIVFGYITFT